MDCVSFIRSLNTALRRTGKEGEPLKDKVELHESVCISLTEGGLRYVRVEDSTLLESSQEFLERITDSTDFTISSAHRPQTDTHILTVGFLKQGVSLDLAGLSHLDGNVQPYAKNVVIVTVIGRMARNAIRRRTTRLTQETLMPEEPAAPTPQKPEEPPLPPQIIEKQVTPYWYKTYFIISVALTFYVVFDRLCSFWRESAGGR
ncbi:ORF77 [Ranid herpesvirus 2]|uniref:ORF77 n=1 Tax=Ranid herpesvirus 2 TaxID=389214 RepID=Q14W29_9VIRU|nr:ORF77 [Ranid herpesvirus 2]ABG25695.1 ORF77 [Ranid herpesvirus 2]